MTLDELNLHYDAVCKLNSAMERLNSMQSFLRAQNIDGLPRNPGDQRKVESLSILIATQAETVSTMEQIVKKEEPRIEAFVKSIPDNRTAQIFALRFLAGYEWQAVAEIIGGKNTESSVKSQCYRYMEERRSEERAT